MAAMGMGSMAAIVAAWLALGLPTPASKEWVREQLDVFKAADIKTIEALHAVQLDVLLNRRDSVAQDIFAQEQALKKAPDDADSARRLRMLKDQLEVLTQQITQLRQHINGD
jgi:ribosomal protein S15P/S13E